MIEHQSLLIEHQSPTCKEKIVFVVGTTVFILRVRISLTFLETKKHRKNSKQTRKGNQLILNIAEIVDHNSLIKRH